jgi:hypothetical protein
MPAADDLPLTRLEITMATKKNPSALTASHFRRTKSGTTKVSGSFRKARIPKLKKAK